MTLGIMQPYLFPYIGYFQLINAVEKFVIYDDVNFIKQGWINRNRILLNGNAHLFTVPIKSISSYKAINEVEVDQKGFSQWKAKFYKTLDTAYRKAPHYKETIDLVTTVFEAPARTINEMASKSILTVCEYLNFSTCFVVSSIIYNNAHLKAQERVLDISLRENATTYINAAGGSELYSKKVFADNGITLKFIHTKAVHYQQSSEPFVPHLSILDLLMFNSKECVRQFLNCYELV
jgi:hypothetical protein